MSRSQSRLVDAHVQIAISTYGVPPELYGMPDTRKGPSWKSSFPEIQPLEPIATDLIISTPGAEIIRRWIRVRTPFEGGVGITLGSLMERKLYGEHRKDRTLEESRDPTVSNIALRDKL